jgi:hypothetical protein
MRYVNETKYFGIKYSTSEDFKLIGYTDSDCGGSIDDKKITSGYTFQFGTGMVSWASRKKPIVTLSLGEAKYFAATSCYSKICLTLCNLAKRAFFHFPMQTFHSFLQNPRAKRYIFSTCTHLAYYTTCVYVGCTTTACVHQDLCPKMKNGVGFPCHDKRSMILGLPHTGKFLTRPFSSI